MRVDDVGVVGVGSLGHAIVETLARFGSRTAVYDVSPEALGGLEALGCVIEPSVECLAASVRVVLVIVSDDEQLQAVVSACCPPRAPRSGRRAQHGQPRGEFLEPKPAWPSGTFASSMHRLLAGFPPRSARG